MSNRIRPLTVAGLTGIVLAVAGCGSSPASGTGTSLLPTSGTNTGSLLPAGRPTTGSLVPGPPAPSATDVVRKLLALARPGTSITQVGTVPKWPPANGSAIPATPTHLSGFGFVDDKAQGIQYLSFAVRDKSGKCAGGDLQANAAGTQITGGKPVTVPAKGPCTGEEVAKLAGHP